MPNLTFYNPTGKITNTFEGSQELYDRFIEAETPCIDGSYSGETHYISEGIAIEKPVKPTKYSIFDYTTKTWVTDLEKIKLRKTEVVKQEASSIILKAYNNSKQVNMQSRFLELLTDGEVDSTEALYLRSCWDWIKSVRQASNEAEVLLNSASSLEDIETIVAEAYNSIVSAPH